MIFISPPAKFDKGTISKEEFNMTGPVNIVGVQNVDDFMSQLKLRAPKKAKKAAPKKKAPVKKKPAPKKAPVSSSSAPSSLEQLSLRVLSSPPVSF